MTAAFISWTSPAGVLQSIEFDVVVSTSVVRTSVITEHPVEKGADVADHYQAQLDKVTIEAYVSNTPIVADSVSTTGTLSDIPLYVLPTMGSVPLDVPVYHAPILSGLPGTAFSAASGALKEGVSALLNGGGGVTANILGGGGSVQKYQLPAALGVFSSVRTFTRDMTNALTKLRDDVQLVSVITEEGSFDSLLLEQLEIDVGDSDGSGATFKCTFRAIRVVESRRVAIPVPVRATPKVSTGQKAAAPTPVRKSLLKKLFGS